MAVPRQNPDPLGEAPGRAAIRACLESRSRELLASVRLYVFRKGLARGAAIDAVALEIMQQTVVEALESAESFDPSRQPMPWLLGIALNLIQQQRTTHARRERIAPMRSLDEAAETASVEAPNPVDGLLDLESDEQVEALLAPLSPDQQAVLRLAVLHDLDYKEVALRLGISPGTARVRAHRALTALRTTPVSTTRDGRHE